MPEYFEEPFYFPAIELGFLVIFGIEEGILSHVSYVTSGVSGPYSLALCKQLYQLYTQ